MELLQAHDPSANFMNRPQHNKFKRWNFFLSVTIRTESVTFASDKNFLIGYM